MTLNMLDFVASPKAKMVNVRLTPIVHDQFKIACDLRGVSMSSLLHQFIVRTIREERELDPKAFEIVTKPIKGELTDETADGHERDKNKGKKTG